MVKKLQEAKSQYSYVSKGYREYDSYKSNIPGYAPIHQPLAEIDLQMFGVRHFGDVVHEAFDDLV